MKLIFLDIDGVINVLGHVQQRAIKELNRIVMETGAFIVVSSTWRHDSEVFGTLRSWGVIGTFLGKTPDLSRQNSRVIVGVERWQEIEEYLDFLQEQPRMVILDDDRDMGKYMGVLVQTDNRVGLTRKDADRAIRLLSR